MGLNKAQEEKRNDMVQIPATVLNIDIGTVFFSFKMWKILLPI